jgi:hypothetical protein
MPPGHKNPKKGNETVTSIPVLVETPEKNPAPGGANGSG